MAGAARFATTHWSVVLKAGAGGGPAADDALAVLCERYWPPLHAYACRRVGDADEARDLTQAFFARLLEKDAFARAAPDRGRFRSFLLAAFQNFLANEWDRANARKRGGGRVARPLDPTVEPADGLTPERAFERQWAVTLLAAVVERLRAEYVAAGKGRTFDVLKGALTGDRDGATYAAAAAEVGPSAAAARQAAHRMRKRYRALLRDEIARTVADPADVEDEIRDLFAALAP